MRLHWVDAVVVAVVAQAVAGTRPRRRWVTMVVVEEKAVGLVHYERRGESIVLCYTVLGRTMNGFSP